MKNNLSKLLEGLNPAQKEAVKQIEGPSLIIAGAGSGKTRVLTSRIANILLHGHSPSSILALTFTNKASGEMKERIALTVGDASARRLWMGTFHSVFIRFLREYAGLIGFPSNFTIYDNSDSKSLLKGLIKEFGLDSKRYKEGAVLSRISHAKNGLVTVSAYLNSDKIQGEDRAARLPDIGQLYKAYQERLKVAGAMDFDDILLFTNILLRDFPEVLAALQARFNFILVDEYQDTNYAQYLIVKRLAAQHRNVCVVGDDAQSIYAFRGARIENILNFRKDYPDAKEFKLEQNYRSTKVIVDAANSLIAKNPFQLQKECTSVAGGGDAIEIFWERNEDDEAHKVATLIRSKAYREGVGYNDFAVLYRTNAQSRPIEAALRARGVPYNIYGGHSFYDRKEIKDLMAYLRLIVNPRDDEAFRRVVNVPRRGIGSTTMARLAGYAAEAGLSLWESVAAVGGADNPALPAIAKGTLTRLQNFTTTLSQLREIANNHDVFMVVNELYNISGYREMVESERHTVEGEARAENVDQLLGSVQRFVEESEGREGIDDVDDVDDADGVDGADGADGVDGIDGAERRGGATLENYLEEISLMSVLDEDDGEVSERVTLMTAHSAKGLEFKHVYIVGLEDGLFPSTTFSSSEKEIAEERRLMYVAITRAKESLTFTLAKRRFRWGSHVELAPSRFIKEIDENCLDARGDARDLFLEGRGGFGTAGSSGSFRSLSSVRGGTSAFGGGRGSGGAGRPGGGRGAGGRGSGGPGAGGRPGGHGSSGFSGRGGSGGSPQMPAITPTRSRPVRAADPNFKPDSPSLLEVGQRIEHDRFGYGTILQLVGEGSGQKAIVDFEEGGEKTLLLKYAKVRIART